MRTLVLQLARFGDIYQTWPALKALVRRGDEVHVLVRERFKDALQGLEGITVHTLPTADLIGALIEGGDAELSMAAMRAFADGLSAGGYQRVVNLSFSPFSSFLTEYIAAEKAEVRGYSRFSDGYLSIPDDSSAYFYAQAEIGGANRFHITDIFAAVAGVELKPEDFAGLIGPSPRERRVIVHLGASQALRIYPGELWISALKSAVAMSSAEWILVGSPDEIALSETVVNAVKHSRLTSRVGQTKLPELMQLIASSSLVIGCDSAPSQMASLTQTPVLQLTSAVANFWTTGPTSPGSRIIYANALQDIAPERIAEEADAMLRGLEPKGPCAIRTSVVGSYTLHDLEFDDFSWNLIQALYTDASYPQTTQLADKIAFQRIFELSELALVNLKAVSEPAQQKTASANLAGIDQMISEIGKIHKRINPLVQWFETQRLRIPPGTMEQTLMATEKIFEDLQLIASVYRRFANPEEAGRNATELCKKLAPALREFEFNTVESEFQDLVSSLHELSRHSTKVGERKWSELLSGLNEALDRRDFIEIADQLEYVLVPALS